MQSLNLRWTDESQLLNGEWLTDIHITAANKLLRKQHPAQHGLQDPLILAEKHRWTSDAADFVQVINLSRQHWVCVSNIDCPPGIVDVYDSILAYSTGSVALRKQVAAILKTQNRTFELHFVDVQCQSGGSDCGLFAIATAATLCAGRDPHLASFDQKEMRSHLHRCFSTGELTLFPQSNRKRRLARHRVVTRKTVAVYCSCRQPWDKRDNTAGDLVQCKICKDWYHSSCESIPDQAKLYSATWLCKKCVDKSV